MRIFYAFLVLVVSAILWMLPVTEAVYDFRTDIRQDSFTVVTGVGVTSANVTLFDFIYDTDTLSYSSSIAEVPVFSSYNGTTKQLLTSGLTENATRELVVSYDVNAIVGAGAIDTLMDKVPFIWLLMIIAFPVAGLAAIFLGKA